MIDASGSSTDAQIIGSLTMLLFYYYTIVLRVLNTEFRAAVSVSVSVSRHDGEQEAGQEGWWSTSTNRWRCNFHF